MELGSFGDLVFEVSSEKCYTVKNVKRTVGKRTAKYTPSRGKEKLMHVGSDLRQVTLSIPLNALLGIKPRDALDRLVELAEGDEVYPLIIGGKPMADNPFALTKLSEDWSVILNGGELATAMAAVTFEEYV